MADYDIGEAFERIQDELLSSMMRNMAHHRKLEEAEGLKYEQWQAQQLQALNEYIQNNPQRFAGTYRKMNSKINDAIRAAYKQGRMDEEIRILQAIKKGYRIQRPLESMQSEFFTINERALNALLDEVNTSVENVQTAILRRANDEYRKAQFNAQVYFGSGAGTLGQAVDMAVHDMLARGLSCVQYKNGRIVGAADYARMALRTARTRAYLQGEASMRDEWGINTVVVKSRSLACPKCIQWVGKVYYDDQWGHIPVKDKKYPRLSEAIKGGLYHPNCKDIHSTYFEGISEPPKPPSDAEIKESQKQYQAEQKKQYIQRNIDKYRRLEKGSVEPENKSKYGALRKQWTERKNSVNTVDNYGESGIINYARVDDLFNYNADEIINITPQDILDDLLTSKIGRKTLEYLENLPQMPKLNYIDTLDGIRAEELEGVIVVYVKNCKDVKTAACSLIHECTHRKYGIGQSQWAESQCVSAEILHRRNRDYLTMSEKRMIIKAVKDVYPEYNWRKGGTVHGRKQ